MVLLMENTHYVVDPSQFMGGAAADYAIETLRNGGLGTRHIPTGKLVPHVLGKSSVDAIRDGIPLPNANSSLMQIGSTGVGALQSGLQVANLGVSLLNLGVAAWTAWKVHKMGKKIDVLDERTTVMNGKLDSIGAFLESSTAHLDRLIRGNAQMLGFLIEHQHHLAEGIELLRQELAQGVTAILERLTNEAAKREAQEFEEGMRKLFGYYERCSGVLREGGEPSRSDLRQIVDLANERIAWIDTRLAAIAPGRSDRLPLFVARALSLRLEIDARELLDESASIQNSEFAKLRASLRHELHGLTDSAPLMALAVDRSAIIGEYVFLHRSLRGNSTMVEFNDGRTLAMYPRDYLVWDDGLEDIRCLLSEDPRKVVPQRIELKTLDEHKAWRRLKGLPKGADDDEIKTSDLNNLLGMSAQFSSSESVLRKLLCKAPDSVNATISKIRAEVHE